MQYNKTQENARRRRQAEHNSVQAMRKPWRPMLNGILRKPKRFGVRNHAR